MQINDQALMNSIVDLKKEDLEVSENDKLGYELDFFFENVLDTVVEYFELEKAK